MPPVMSAGCIVTSPNDRGGCLHYAGFRAIRRRTRAVAAVAIPERLLT